jgi:uncharacterized protein YyaL (SSP411 family)
MASAPEISEHVNRLGREKSPYLLQHAHNPVDWFPWGKEAFSKARKENKPIFLSIGYSTCHWCHVMAHESFENAETAAIMNREFVNIKVDREERPDVDRVYMTFVQATTGGGGWPMSVWLTPELQPFVGGTYFPPEDRHGQPGFAKVLERIAATWRQNHIKIAEQGAKIIAALQEAGVASSTEKETVDAKVLAAGYEQLARAYDAHEGGFSNAPKFPRPATLNFLFRVYARERKSTTGKHALEMNLHTLRKMAAGGMHDHLGGGFHRYSVDALWHVPHFEKMLYDQAQLAIAYLEAFQITRDPEFEKVARGILDYVRREMTAKSGGFFSAEDADSLLEHGKPAHAEGAFYVWTKEEIDDSLGTDAGIFEFHYGVEPGGNAAAGSDPHGEFAGKNVLIQRHTVAETAKQFAKNENEIGETLERARAKLFALRAKRPRPHLDDKIITAWNGLMISAFARAAQILDDSHYLESAQQAAQFLRRNLYDESSKTLRRNFREEPGTVAGFAEDYAFFVQALLDLYEADFDFRWLQFAEELQETQDRIFFDQKHGGYFSTSGEDESVLLRMKEDNDGAEPSPNSIGALNLLRLAQVRGAAKYREHAEKTMRAFAPILGRAPTALPQMLVAVDYSLGKPRQIVIAGKKKDAATILKEVRRHFLPTTTVLLADQGEGQKYLAEKLETLRAMKMIDGKATAYVCENFTCKAPVTDAGKLQQLLS